MTDRNENEVVYGVSPITDHDVYLFKEGRHFKLYDKLGSHRMEVDGKKGVHFAVWAPNAATVSVSGDFNGWSQDAHFLKAREDGSGIWEGFIPGLEIGTRYKYVLRFNHNDYTVAKCDPYGFLMEEPPGTASVVWDLDYEWHDQSWMETRGERNGLNNPWSIYEVHLGSWRRSPDEDFRPLTYRETAPQLARYLSEMGFTHVELLPVMEHPFYGSWGYQVTGFFAPTARYGSPQDLMHLIETLHLHGIGVILDWVPAHFPTDEHGLIYFDGTHVYEHADSRQGIHPEWKSAIFNYGRYEVRSFLISSAMFWLEKYHVDGFRVDAVASMLYLDYGRKDGEWVPNQYGGRENIEAVEFIRALNESVYRDFPDIQTIAEESTAWPMVSRPPYLGGLGFGMKWNMGWMHDTLDYMSKDPIHRKFHHNQLTFSIMYAFSENFVLPISHDEVVHGKGSVLGKMPGDEWQRFANLRLLYGYMWAHPGKKLLFMGGEFAQSWEWYHEKSLDWHLLEYPFHLGVKRWVEDLNRLYKNEPCLYELDFHADGFRWIDCNDWESSVISFIRRGASTEDVILVVLNFTPVARTNYRIGAPHKGFWAEILNSDAHLYGGSGWGNLGGLQTTPVPCHGHDQSLSVNVPPLAAVFFKWEKDRQTGGGA